MRLGRVVAYLLIGLGAVVMMLPFYWMVITAVSPAPDIIAFPPKWIPSHLTLDHFREAAAKAPWLLYYKNSLVVATASVGLSVSFGVFAGYAFAVYKFPLQNFSFLLILGTLMVPVQVTSVSLYVVLAVFNCVVNYAGIVVLNFVIGLVVFVILEA